MYITDAGYSGCGGKQILFKFNGDDKIYKTDYVTSGVNNESWFISSFYDIEIYEFIEKLKTNNSFSVRMRSDCGSTDYNFTLRGSTKALNFVLGENWLKEKKENRRKDSIELIKNKEVNRLKIELKRKEDSIAEVELKKKKQNKRMKDSLINVKLEKQRKIFLKELSDKCKIYLSGFSDENYHCYYAKYDAGLREKIHYLDDYIKVSKGEVFLVDPKYKNKRFYKVVNIRGATQVSYYILKDKTDRVFLIRE